MSPVGRFVFPVLLLLLGGLVYSTGLRGPFIFDDYRVVVDNPAVVGDAPLPIASRVFCDVTFRLNHWLGGLVPEWFRVVNITIHLLGGWVLFGIARRVLARRVPVDRCEVWAGFLALAWVLHPLQTQAVTYISQRYESLMGLFALLTLYAFIRGADGGRIRAGWYVCSILCCALGMATKDVMVSTPLVVLAFDYVFLAAGFRDLMRKRGGYYAGLFATWGLAAWLLYRGLAMGAGGITYITSTTDRWTYLLSQQEILLHYVRLVLYPWGQCFDYAWEPVASIRHAAPYLVVVSLLLAGTLFLLARRHALGFLGACFFLYLAPTSSVLPVADLAAEHRMYLASIGILGSLGWGVWRVMGSRGKERFPGSVRAVLACGVVGLAILTYIRNEVYSRETSLWRDTVKTRPQNVRARVSLSSALLREGNPSLAEGFARSAIEMLPDFSSRSAVKHGMTGSSAFERKELYQVGLYVIAHNDLGIALFQQGKAALATNAYACALAVMPGFESAKENMALAMGSLGKQIEALEIWIDLAKMATERGDIPRVQVCLTNAERELVQSTLPSERVKHFSDQISEMRTRIKVWSD